MDLVNLNPHEKGGAWPIALASHIAQIAKQVPKAHQKPSTDSGQDHLTRTSWVHTIFLHYTKNIGLSPCFHGSYDKVNTCGVTEQLDVFLTTLFILFQYSNYQHLKQLLLHVYYLCPPPESRLTCL